jgi:serine phosphatase RsbU (regulator of sigma subunit)
VAAAAGAAAATEASQPEEQLGNDQPAKVRDATPSWPLTRQDDLPQPLRVVRDVVEVVPTPLRILVAGLVALSVLLGLASALTLLRNRRLARQRRELLGQVGLLQAALLPGMPDKLGTARASVAYRPADGPGAGGDFYDVFPLAAGRTAVLIGDVSGHGRAALGRTALSRYTLRAYVEAGLEPREALQIAGSVLAGKLQGDFVTAMVAIHDAGAGTLTYSTAGHPPPIVISGAGFVPVLAATAPPLGVGAGTGQRQTTLPFPRGAVACFYTAGLTEARTRDGQLGAERLEEIVRELGPAVTAKQVIDSVASSAGTITDDAAVCVLAAEEGLAVVRSRVERLELSRAELRGPMLAGFLDSCGVPHRQARAAERDARALAREHGGAILEVRMGDVAQVDVRPPELPVRDDVMASLQQP